VVKGMKEQVWWQPPVISALWRLRQEDHEFKGSLGNTEKACFKKEYGGNKLQFFL
jgi:hypothetical protein